MSRIQMPGAIMRRVSACLAVAFLAASVVPAAPVFAGGAAPVADVPARTTAAAGYSWATQSSGTTSTLNGVNFVSSTTGWAVGNDGVVLRTTDGGAHWTPQSSGTTETLQAVRFVSATTGWIVGDNGTILRTTNSGATWTKQTSGTTNRLFGLQFLSASKGWVVGYTGTILYTSDGGANWTPQNSSTVEALHAVAIAADGLTGWIVGQEGLVLRTTNGGVSWALQESGTNEALYSVKCADKSTAWVAGENGRILLTTDGGANWSAAVLGVIPPLVSLDFTDGIHGWAVGQSGTVVATSDGGRSWALQSSSTIQQLVAVDFVEYASGARVGWAVGLNGRIIKYTATPIAGVVTRIAGADRYAVAASLARKGWDAAGTKAWTNVGHVVIANGESGREADPLTAAGLAGAYDAPLLLVSAASVPWTTKSVITEIAARRRMEGRSLAVHIVGGTTSVPDARWNEIRSIPGVSIIKDRLAGSDRYAVSAAIAQRMVAIRGVSDIPGVILVAADDPNAFYDALAASPISYAKKMPMLSVRKTTIPPSVASILKGSLSGKLRFSASSSAFIGSVPAAGSTRMSTNSNRYTSATQIAAFARSRRWLAVTDAGITAKLPDALSGGAFLGERGGVMLFTDSSAAIQSVTKTFISGNGAAIDKGWVLGGTASIPAAQESSFRSLTAK